MKRKEKFYMVVVVLICVLLGRGCGHWLNSRPIIVDCTDVGDRKYFVTYEVKAGEHREQVKAKVDCSP